MQLGDVVLQTVPVNRRNRGQFLNADLDDAGEIPYLALGRADDSVLRAQTNDYLGAQRQEQQHHHQRDQFGFEIEEWQPYLHKREIRDTAIIAAPVTTSISPGRQVVRAAADRHSVEMAAEKKQRREQDDDPDQALEPTQVMNRHPDLCAEEIAERNDDRN
jgi:hypothetical protein